MVFYTFGFTVSLKKGQKKKRKWYLSNWKKKKKKKQREKQNSATMMISVDEKGAVFLVKLKLQGESFE